MWSYISGVGGKIEGKSSGDCAGKGHFLECHNELIFPTDMTWTTWGRHVHMEEQL